MEKDIYEQYVDATIAVFMEEYSDAETEYLLKKCKEEPLNEEFPEELDIKCKELMRKSFAKKKRQKALKASKRILQRVAVFVLVSTSAFSVLFLTVEAVRTPIINFYLENYSDHSVVTIRGDDNDQSAQSMERKTEFTEEFLIYNDMLENSLPSSYQFEMDSIDDDKYGFIMYRDRISGADVCFEIRNSSGNMKIDTENCDYYEEIMIGSQQGLYIEKEGRKTILWIDSKTEAICSLIADDMDKNLLISLGQKMISAS